MPQSRCMTMAQDRPKLGAGGAIVLSSRLAASGGRRRGLTGSEE
jgi:hypothetical protein